MWTTIWRSPRLIMKRVNISIEPYLYSEVSIDRPGDASVGPDGSVPDSDEAVSKIT
jgi:hypothetical protein